MLIVVRIIIDFLFIDIFCIFFFQQNIMFILTCFFISLLYISTANICICCFSFCFFLIFVIRLCLYRCESTRLFWCDEYMSPWRLRALQNVSFGVLRRCLERQRMWYWCWSRWLLKQRTFYKIDFFSNWKILIANFFFILYIIMSNNNFYSDDFFFLLVFFVTLLFKSTPKTNVYTDLF